jgi:AcrR family transcriptional regulator
MVTSEHRRLRADAVRNRQALIDAAERLFTTRGLSVTLDDIAAEAGVNVATAYRHFANKHELGGAFLQQKIDQAIAIAKAAVAADDPWQGLTEFLTRTLDLMAANRGLHDVFTPGYATEWLEQLDQRVNPLLQQLLVRGQRAGLVRADLQPGDLGVILQMLATVSDLPVADQAALLRRYLQIVLAGLRPTDEPLTGAPPSPAEVLVATTSRPRRAAAASLNRRRDPGRQHRP